MEFFELVELKRGFAGSEFSPPAGVCFSGGITVVSDEFNHRLELRGQNGTPPTFVGKRGAGPGEFYYPKGVQCDADGNFYVADCWNHRIQKFSESLDFILSFGKYGSGPGEFNEPYSIATGPDNFIYVVDRCNHRIQFFDTDGNFMGSAGQRGTALEEELAELYGTPENLFKKPSFEFPNDIAFDSRGNMFVVDSNNHRIVSLDRRGELICAFGGSGSGYEEFRFPYGICIDENDLLFISDMNNERVRVFTPQGVPVGSYKGDKGRSIQCPTTIRRFPAGDICFSTGFSTSLFSLGYSSFTLSDFYKNNGSRRENRLQSAVWLHDSGEEEAAVDTFISFLSECAPEDLITEIGRRPEYINFLLKVTCVSSTPSGEYFDIVNVLFENSFEKQKKRVIELLDKRAELARELFENQHRRESEILNGKDTFNPALITLERRDRELFREIRSEMLKLKRVFVGSASFTGMVHEHERDGSMLRKRAADMAARHTLTLLRCVLDILDEREGLHIGRERSFRDETISREDSLADFRFITLLFDNVDCLTGIFVDLLRDHISEVIRVSASFSQEESGLFRQTLDGSSGGAELAELVAGIYLFTQDNSVPYYASIQPVLTEFVTLFYKSALKTVDMKNPFCVGGNKSILKQVFYLIMLENHLLVSGKKFAFRLAPEIKKIHEKSFEDVNNSIKNVFAEAERISAEAALLDVRVNQTVIRDEKLRVTLTNRLDLHSFAERLNSRKLATLFSIQRVNLLALQVYEGYRKRVESVKDLLNRSFENFYRYPDGMSGSEEGKVKAFVDLKVNAIKQLLKKSSMDIATIWKAEEEKPDISGFSGIMLKSSIPATRKRESTLINPVGICREPGGTFLIADSGNNTVVGVREDGQLTDRWYGRDGFDGKFAHPFGIAADLNGNVFVSEWYKHRICKFDLNGKFISSFGRQGSGEGEFNLPGRVAVDKDGCVYVCDQLNGRIQKFDNHGNHLLSFSGEARSGRSLFARPCSILITISGELLAGDYSGGKICLFDLEGRYISDFYSVSGYAPSCVVDISQSPDGTVFISDFWNGEVILLTNSGECLGKIGGEGRGQLEFQGLAASQVIGNSLLCCDFFGGRVKVVKFDSARLTEKLSGESSDRA